MKARTRDLVAALFALLLIAALAIGILMAMGKQIPIISDLLR